MAKRLVLKNDKFSIESFKISDPEGDYVTVRNTYASFDRYDFECMTGSIKFSQETNVFGLCSVGVVEKIGPNVSLFSKGDRVLYCSHNFGAYSNFMNVKQTILVGIPDYVPDDAACSSFLKIITAQYLVSAVYNVRKNSRVLVLGVSGGMGSIISQLAKFRGARVLGFTSSADELNHRVTEVCDEVIEYKCKDFLEKVIKYTFNRGGHVLYDPIGKGAFGLAAVALGGLGVYVNFGRANGIVDNVSVPLLHNGALTFVSPSYHCYLNVRSRFMMYAANAFLSIKSSDIIIPNRISVNFDKFPEQIKNANNERRFGFRVVKF